jgi:hypothetical protein
MKEKLLWFAVVLLGAALATSHAQSPSTNVGRFQLYNFETRFRVDTVTGQTWALTFGKTPDGQDSLAWMAVPENAKPGLGPK